LISHAHGTGTFVSQVTGFAFLISHAQSVKAAFAARDFASVVTDFAFSISHAPLVTAVSKIASFAKFVSHAPFVQAMTTTSVPHAPSTTMPPPALVVFAAMGSKGTSAKTGTFVSQVIVFASWISHALVVGGNRR